MTRTAISPRLATSTRVNMRYIRNTPYFAGAIGALQDADTPSARASRVCSGSRMPSSHSARGGVVGRALGLVLLEDRRPNRGLLLLRQRLPLASALIALHGGQHRGGLFAAHHRDAGVGPHPQQPRVVRPPAHPVVARAERPADDDRELRHRRVGHGMDHLGAVFGDAGPFVLLAHHEARDVLHEDQRDAAHPAQLDEVRGLERRLGEQHAVVGDDADEQPLQVREAGDDGRRVEALELVEARSVHQARQHLAHVVLLARVGVHDPVDLRRVVGRILGRRAAGRQALASAAAPTRCRASWPARARRRPPGSRPLPTRARARRRRPDLRRSRPRRWPRARAAGRRGRWCPCP